MDGGGAEDFGVTGEEFGFLAVELFEDGDVVFVVGVFGEAREGDLDGFG